MCIRDRLKLSRIPAPPAILLQKRNGPDGGIPLSLIHILPSSRERIEAAIEELQYTPSAMARYLRTKRTYTVKAVMESITIPFFAEMFETLRRDLEERGYTTILQTTDSRPFSTRDFDCLLYTSRCV